MSPDSGARSVVDLPAMQAPSALAPDATRPPSQQGCGSEAPFKSSPTRPKLFPLDELLAVVTG